MNRKKLLSLGLAGLVSIASGCSNYLDNLSGLDKAEPFTLRVSEIKMVPPESRYMKYDGMPNKEVFSLSPSIHTSSSNYSSDAKKIFFYGKNYEVLSVDAEKITLKFIEEVKAEK